MSNRVCYGCMEYVEPAEEKCKCGFDDSEYSPQIDQLPPGYLLHDKYLIGAVLGQGGFGITYVGRDTILDMKVAIKEFYMTGYVSRNNTHSCDVLVSAGNIGEVFEKNKEKFLQEARTLAKFSSEDGIVGVREFFKDNNTAYIVMDFLEGITLKDYLKEKGKISLDQTLKLIEPVLRSLGSIHEQHLIHRDISPDNIMLCGKDYSAKLLDFGAAREAAQGEASLSVILKPGFAPQEQYRRRGNQGPWTDIYALCATIYTCITGIVPEDSMDRVFEDMVVPPCQLSADCSEEISAVIMKGMAINPEDRYQNITALREALANPPAVQGNMSEEINNKNRTVYAEIASDPEPVVKQISPVVDNTESGSEKTVADKLEPTHETRVIQQTIDKRPDASAKKKRGGIIAIAGVVLALVVVVVAIIVKGGSAEVTPASDDSSISDFSSADMDNNAIDDSNSVNENIYDSSSNTQDTDESAVVETSGSNGNYVGIAMPTSDLQRWNQDGAYLKDLLENDGYTVDLKYASNDISTQVYQLYQMIDEGCDVLIVAAIDGGSLVAPLESAKEAGITIISYDRLLMNTDAVDYYVTFNNYMVGTLQAEYIIDKLDLDNSDGWYTIEFTAGDYGDANAYRFYEGAMGRLESYIAADKLRTLSGQTGFSAVCTGSWSTETAQVRAEKILLSAYVDLIGVDAWLCSNDSTALGVTNALEANYETGLELTSGNYTKPYPIVTGQDCDIANVKNIIAGKQAMSVFKDTRVICEQTAKMTEQALTGQTVDINDVETYDNGTGIIPAYLCAPTVVDASNYLDVLVGSGYYTLEDFE